MQVTETLPLDSPEEGSGWRGVGGGGDQFELDFE